MKQIAIMFDTANRLYTAEFAYYFKIKFEEMGGKIIASKNFDSGMDVSYTSLAEEVVHSDAEGVLILANGYDNALLSQKLVKLKPDIKKYAGMWSMTEELILHGGEAVEGMVMPGVYDENGQQKSLQRFIKQFNSVYKTKPSFSALCSYEAVQLIAQAMQESKRIDGNSIREKILEMRNVKGIQGNFTIDRFGDSNRGYYLFTVEHGEFKRIHQ